MSIFISWVMASFLMVSQVLKAAEPMPLASLYGRDSQVHQQQAIAPDLQLKTILKVASSVQLRHARIYLQDLASCSGSVDLCHDILAIDLGPSPKPGHEQILQIEDFRRALDQEFPKHDIEIQMPQRPRLTALQQSPDVNAIKSLVEENLQTIDGNLRFFLVSARIPVGLRLRHNNYAIEFPSWQQDLAIIRQNPRRGLVNLMVQLIDQEPGSTESWDFIAQLTLRAEAQVAVTLKAIERGQAVAKEAIAWQWMPYQENAIHDAAALESQLAKMPLRQGQVLRTYDLSRDPDVRRGEKVEASVLANGVKMNSSAQAMESAAIGQRIRIQLDTTKRQVMATVTGRSQVEVHMP